MNRATILCIAIVASVARADRGVVVTLGASVAYDRYQGMHGSVSTLEERWGPGLEIDATYRIFDELSLGVHVAASRGEHESRCTEFGSAAPATHVFGVIPAFVGVSAEYTVIDQIWFAPWIGMLELETHFVRDDGKCDSFYGYEDRRDEQRLAYGLGLGVDMFVRGRHRVGPFVQLARGRRTSPVYTGPSSAGYYPDDFDDDLLITFGVAYRYR